MKTLKILAGLMLALPLAAAAVPAHERPAAPYTDAEIDALLAPIALYPDSVLSHVLIAATVPEDVEDAAEWSRRHPDLKGQAAVDAVANKDWDPSVKALVAFPDVLARMDEDPEWTEDVGIAFLEQEATVMDRVQYLRDRADAAGTLDDVEHVRVVREREYIYLEPAVTRVVYVPYYDPWHVYGTWWWPYYPPHHWAYWGGYPARHYYGSTFYWGVSFHLGPSYYYSRFNWPHRHVVVSRPHRHYAPPPGYSGRSTMRRPDSRSTARSAVRSDRRAQRAPQWREDTGWRNRNMRRGAEGGRAHDQRAPARNHPGYRSERRNAEQVRRQLSDRRSAPGRPAGAHERREQAHERRDDRRGQQEDRREARDDRREHHENRREGREGPGQERSHGGGREMSRGQAREREPRPQGRGRRER